MIGNHLFWMGSMFLSADSVSPADSLVGIWEAQKRFGPEIEGALEMRRSGTDWTAEIAGFTVDVEVEGEWLNFSLPNQKGGFRGRAPGAPQGTIQGHWIQPALVCTGYESASPVVLSSANETTWRGTVKPLNDRFTFFLVIEQSQDGTLSAFLRNPERNLGIYLRVERAEIHEDRVQLLGHFGRSSEEAVIAEGALSSSQNRLRLDLADRGTYEFSRVEEGGESNFYARGVSPSPWVYIPPERKSDGWEVSTLGEVDLSPEPIREMIETLIDRPARDIHAPYPHAILIVRYGALVLEEYFHGFTGSDPHDTRSASKSLTAVLAGAAIEAGAALSAKTRVYETLRGNRLSGVPDFGQSAMNVEHLLTMSSGLFCDDGNPNAPGNEDTMQTQQEELDWYRYTLDLPQFSPPGTEAIYCSVNANLLGAVISAKAEQPLEVLFQDLIATPLEITEYHLNLQPTGEPYMGGGIQWLPRDFLKLGQVMLDGGLWKGQRIMNEEWTFRSTEPLVQIGGRDYGYLWWVEEFPYRDGTISGFLAGGNGGQLVMGVPELDLVVSFFAGNYNDSVFTVYQNEWMPEYILKSVID